MIESNYEFYAKTMESSLTISLVVKRRKVEYMEEIPQKVKSLSE